MKQGKCIIFSAPSGAGKTTLVKHLLGKHDFLAFSISATSRECRKGETHGVDYLFLSQDEFELKIKQSEFIEWEEVYAGTYYGTLKSEIERIWAEGKTVLFDVDIEGALSLKRYFGEQALSIFVKPPSVDALRDRLIGRGTETTEKMQMRLDKAIFEIQRESDFEKIILNKDLDVAKAEAEKLVAEFLN